MLTHVLDTDTASLLQSNHPRVVARVSAALAAVGVTVITVDESMSGWYNLIRAAKQPSQVEFAYAKLAATVRTLGRFTIANYSLPAQARYAVLRKQIKNVGGNDLRIAAIALDMNAVVVTRNAIDFGRVPGLVTEDWSV